MSGVFEILQKRYQALAARKADGEEGEAFQEDVTTFLADARRAGASVADLDERSQLRAWMRFLAQALYDATGIYPDISLEPLARGQLAGQQPPPSERPATAPSLVWALVGGAAAVAIAAGLVAIGWLSRRPEPDATRTEMLTPTPAPAVFVSHLAVGREADPSGGAKGVAETFCLGTQEIVAEVALEGVEPAMDWRWELRRGGALITDQPAAPWGERSAPATVPILAGGPEGIPAGEYDLRIYVNGRPAGAHSFRVLETAPRVSGLQVSDVPEPAGVMAGAPAFELGVRVIFLSYAAEGMCPGLQVAHTLSGAGEAIQERVDRWSGTPQERVQVAFQGPDGQPFPAGEYAIALEIEGEEQASVPFTIGETTVETVEPGFGAITLALGVEPDGTPILSPPDDRFDWNTKTIYAIFDYVGMRDGLRWAAVWTRAGQEVARQEAFWDLETSGTEGTHWTVYNTANGLPIPGGPYSVTLTIADAVQGTAGFDVTYYVPPEE
jgi:hypothetical protein